MTNETESNQVDASTSAHTADKEAVLAYLNERGKQREGCHQLAELEQAQKQVEAYRERDADLVAYIEESWAFQEHLMEMLDDTKERLAAAQKEAEDPEAGAARLIKLAEILTSDRNSSGNSEQE